MRPGKEDEAEELREKKIKIKREKSKFRLEIRAVLSVILKQMVILMIARTMMPSCQITMKMETSLAEVLTGPKGL